MKSVVFILAAGLSLAAPVQLVITSFNQNGQLTWTNFVSNGTYLHCSAIRTRNFLRI